MKQFMKKEITYVIGHKNPDTDSICSAIGLAELKIAEGSKNVVAARAGDLNPQTTFILDYFKVQPPRFLPDVHAKAKDIMSVDIVKVSHDTPLRKVMELMRQEEIRFIPVLDEGGRPKGVLTLMDLAKRYIESESSQEITTSFKNIIETLGATSILDFYNDSEITVSMLIGAMAEESFLTIVCGKNPKECALIVGDRADIQKKAIEKGIGLLIVSGGFSPDAALIEEAKKNSVSILVSPYDTATTALLLRLSTPACKLCDGQFEKASPEDLADDLKHRLANVSGLTVLDENGVMQGVITKSNLLQPSGTNLILVDHNELSQAIDGADKANIVEVVDHHRIGDFRTSTPIPFICEPVGSTSTLVSEFYKRRNVPIKKEIAGLLLGGVMSDTVILKSPTTTERDKEIVKWLEEQSGLDHKKFGSEIFAATSSLKKRGAEAAVNSDYKVFEAKGKKFGVGQVETIGFDEFFEVKASLMEELDKAMKKKGVVLSALLITDIVVETSLLLAIGEKEVLFNLNYPKVEENVYELKNVLSRKKQVVPHLINVFNEIY